MSELDNKGWNVFILFQYYKNENAAIYDLFVHEIESVAVNSNIDFYVLKFEEDKEISYYTLPQDSKERKLQLVKPAVSYTDIYEYPFISIKNAWTEFFDLCTDHKKRNFIAIHNHGAGLGLTPMSLDRTDKAIIKNLSGLLSHGIISYEKFNYLKHNGGFVEKLGGTLDLRGDDIKLIPVAVFSKAITDAVLFKETGPVDFLCLSNCFMQCAETAYVLRNAGKYLVASEGVSISGGVNYPNLFEAFSKNLQNNELAINICKHFDERFDNDIYKTYKTKDSNSIYDIRSYIDLSIIDLSKCDQFKTLISNLGQELVNLSNNEASFLLLGNIRLDETICQEVYNNNPTGIIDMCNYLYELAILEEFDPEIKKSFYHFINFVKHELVAASHFSTRSYLRGNSFGICPSGISIFFPMNKNFNSQNEIAEFSISNFYMKKENLSEFLDDNHWRDFVIKFYRSDLFQPKKQSPITVAFLSLKRMFTKE